MLRASISLTIMMLLFASPAFADKRVALVIGNGAYVHAAELPNPPHDSADMSAALKSVGFVVIEGTSLDKPAMEKKIREFSEVLNGADIGVFFYSGHGLQVGGVNYLVPVDAILTSLDALEFEMVRLDLIQKIVERRSKTSILFLDACRNNPLARNLARALGTCGAEIGRGLAPAESGAGTLISYSTQPGNVALDGEGRNSPYTGPLVKRIVTKGQDLLTTLMLVRRDVLAATGNKQVPWDTNALTDRFYFNPGVVAAAAAGVALEPPLSEAAQAWALIKDTSDPAALKAFLGQFPDTVYAVLAQQRLTKQGSAQVASAAHSASPKAAPLKPVHGQSFRDCPEVCPEMLVVPAGQFMPLRKSNGPPPGKIAIASPIAVGKFEITFEEWEACVAGRGCDHQPDDQGWGRGKRPVIDVSWDDTQQYIAWLNNKLGLNPANGYRLLSSAEWEYSVWGMADARYFSDQPLTMRHANITEGWGTKKSQQTQEVGTYPPNSLGLYDLEGNVAEWVEDCQGRHGYCVSRVVRGLRFDSNGIDAFSSVGSSIGNFSWDGQGNRSKSIGFRLARSL